MTSSVVFRADAGLAIGSGHVMRSLALARTFDAGGWSIAFAATKETFDIVPALAAAKFKQIVLSGDLKTEARELAAYEPIDILVIDHYGRDVIFERSCRTIAKFILVIDDFVSRQHECDLLVNSNAMPQTADLNLVPASCRVLAGPAYAALDPSFRRARTTALARRDGRPVERVLVSFGQVDPPNATLLALRALKRANFGGAIDIVIGGNAPHLESIRKELSRAARLHVDTANMPALMTEADLAIGAGGTTSWERCCLGLPTLLLEIADNQRGVISTIASAGAGLDIGKFSEVDSGRMSEAFIGLVADRERRISMSRAGSLLVDGLGTERIFEMLT